MSGPSISVPDPIELTRAQLAQLLTCQICFSEAQSAAMCPFCSKLYCQPCIQKSLSSRPECPHCRAHLAGPTQMASCDRFVR